ncbi:LysR family transcriptional regulator [Janthinobacterium sp. PC23-8]|uniref:LysR family transcriptional regulator n=1 Tax=Janthinobacterium sp. PC23-8 TaxID=2012679 RepID=UPI000B978E54|nr:LysR family transcriptional regulator [Janthinobacterium sp. PC23-8]OYO29759.1 LysR family transcriptional regulator [Janthinobacterium sp. PC23-8]
MEMRQLKYFHAVAQSLSFSRAADMLHVAQPALSRQIRQLEEILQIQLFDRESRPIALTAAGRFFHEQTLQVAARLAEIEEGARRIAEAQRPWFGIGFVPSVMYGVLPNLIRQFRLDMPDIESGFIELMTMEQATALKLGRIDIGFGRLPIHDPAISCVTLVREPLLAALPAGHRLTQRPTVDLPDLAREPLIVYPARPRPSYADQVLELFSARHLQPAQVREANEMQTALGLVAAGVGVALVPASVQGAPRNGVLLRPLSEPELVSPVIMNFRTDDRSPILARFREMATHMLPMGFIAETPATDR